MEYNWQPEGEYVRTRLADFPASGMLDFNPPLGGRQTLQYSGGEDNWTAQFRGQRPEALAAFYQQFITLARQSGWQMEPEEPEYGPARSEWRKTDFAGRRWRCVARFEQQEWSWIQFSLEKEVFNGR